MFAFLHGGETVFYFRFIQEITTKDSQMLIG